MFTPSENPHHPLKLSFGVSSARKWLLTMPTQPTLNGINCPWSCPCLFAWTPHTVLFIWASLPHLKPLKTRVPAFSMATSQMPSIDITHGRCEVLVQISEWIIQWMQLLYCLLSEADIKEKPKVMITENLLCACHWPMLPYRKKRDTQALTSTSKLISYWDIFQPFTWSKSSFKVNSDTSG